MTVWKGYMASRIPSRIYLLDYVKYALIYSSIIDSIGDIYLIAEGNPGM
jgi:hypothetical protein